MKTVNFVYEKGVFKKNGNEIVDFDEVLNICNLSVMQKEPFLTDGHIINYGNIKIFDFNVSKKFNSDTDSVTITINGVNDIEVEHIVNNLEQIVLKSNQNNLKPEYNITSKSRSKVFKKALKFTALGLSGVIISSLGLMYINHVGEEEFKANAESLRTSYYDRLKDEDEYQKDKQKALQELNEQNSINRVSLYNQIGDNSNNLRR